MALVKHNPGHIYFTGRNSTAASEIISSIKKTTPNASLTFIFCDQSSLVSVSKAAKEFLSKSSRLDILLCNAGVMATSCGLTKDGYENQFGINHMAHALFVKLLLPTLQKTQKETNDVRVVFLTSLGFKMPPKGGIDFENLKTVQDTGPGGPWTRYGQSKLANVIYPAELAKHYPDITFVSIHPGTIATDIISRLGLVNKLIVYLTNFGKIQKLEYGAYQLCWASTADKSKVRNGAFYEPVGILGLETKESTDEALWEKLWAWTAKELEGFN